MSLVSQRLSVAEVLGHELRNPLASVVAGISLANEMTDEGDPRSGYLRQALTDLSRVSTLLTSYLELGRSRGPNSAFLDLAGLARQVAERYSGVVVVAGDPSVPMHGDPAMLERMLENLLDNAMTAGARRVEIHLSRQGDKCTMDVSDNGPGVAPEIGDRLFQPFVSGRGSTGLGLTIVREIVEAHRGAIALVPGESGATFRSVFPSSCS